MEDWDYWGALESSKVKFSQKMLQKTKHISNGKVVKDQVKSLIIELEVKDQRILLLFESERSVHFRFIKTRLVFLVVL